MGRKNYEVSVFLTPRLEAHWEEWVRCASRAIATFEFRHHPNLSVEEQKRRQRMLDAVSKEAWLAAAKLEREILVLYRVTPDIARLNREGQCLIWTEPKNPL
jgi:hypothetical protein